MIGDGATDLEISFGSYRLGDRQQLVTLSLSTACYSEDGSSLVAVDLQQLNLHNVICQTKSGMGKTVVFVLSTLQQIEPVAGQAAALVLCHTRELAYQSFRVVQLLSHVLVLQSRYILCTAFRHFQTGVVYKNPLGTFRLFKSIIFFSLCL
ncbi:hypothetical protein ES332_A09G102000v1 [Gossypium tomentosum]|uniref:DEAD/DEAH-box helicase domain-containing protein n=1 Tax=Gossypium tomentosum TaxID=34277 RepID=A0A5D2P3I0_GOSTO|nr:hypothetical protein ES332_A09G102000v1 [Gossypium tomentosum]